MWEKIKNLTFYFSQMRLSLYMLNFPPVTNTRTLANKKCLGKLALLCNYFYVFKTRLYTKSCYPVTLIQHWHEVYKEQNWEINITSWISSSIEYKSISLYVSAYLGFTLLRKWNFAQFYHLATSHSFLPFNNT